MQKINFPDSLLSIRKDAFLGCDQLETICYLGTMQQWVKMCKANKLDSYDWNMTVISNDGLVAEEDYDGYDEGEDD